MLPIYPYADEQEHVSLVYDAPMAFQIHFCLTICQNTIRQTINSSTCQPINFCKIFSKKFNTKSGLSIPQLPTLPQKIDSCEGLF